MEPPTAKEIIKQENSYSIISDKNHSFNLIFQNLNSTIGILASYENDFIKHNYEKKLILDELKQNKYLALCETIDEIYDELIRLLNKNQFKIIEETNSIYISIPIEHSKLKEILFEVNEIIKNDSEKINELFSIISNMKKEIKEFKEQFKNEEINNLKEDNKNMKQEIKNLIEEIKTLKENSLKDLNEKNNEEYKTLKDNNLKEIKDENKILKEEINNLKEEIKNMKKNNLKEIKDENLKKEINELNSFIPYLKEYKKKSEEKKSKISNLNSLIIKDNVNYNKTLKNWINPEIKIKSELLYRMSRDGIETKTFHNLCDNKGPTIILIKLTDDNILGLYNPLDWDSKSGVKSDLNMFVFSLTENLKCMKNNLNNYGILCDDDYGPYSYFLRFYNNKMNKPYIVTKNSGFNDCQKLYPGKDEGYYDAEEVEVYNILLGI